MKTVITFCCNNKKCPVVTVEKDEIKIGGKKEGITVWDKGQFKDFVEAAKSGKFDNIIKT